MSTEGKRQPAPGEDMWGTRAFAQRLKRRRKANKHARQARKKQR